MASLLATGGAGFIGTNFVHHWTAAYPHDRVVVLDALTYAGRRENLSGAHVELVHGDICDTALVEELLGTRDVDTLIHFAAETHVDRSIHGPDAFIQTNVLGTHSLLKAARKVWLEGSRVQPHRFHHVSTDEVFGSLAPDAAPFNEASAYTPNSPYAASKAASDHLVRAYQRTFGLQATITHCSNNYGPYQNLEKLIPQVLTRCLEGKPLPIYGDGLNIRDWLHVQDHVRAIALVLKRGQVGETYNIGGGAERMNVDLVDLLCALIDQAFAADPELAGRFPEAPAAQGVQPVSLKHFVPDRPGHDRRYAIDGEKARQQLGYSPVVTLGDGLAETIAWYLNNESWWR